MNTPLSYCDLKAHHFHENRPHEFSGFASDLPHTRQGWPSLIETTIGNGMPLLRKSKKVDADGDIQYVRYTQANGCIEIVVFND